MLTWAIKIEITLKPLKLDTKNQKKNVKRFAIVNKIYILKITKQINFDNIVYCSLSPPFKL